MYDSNNDQGRTQTGSFTPLEDGQRSFSVRRRFRERSSRTTVKKPSFTLSWNNLGLRCGVCAILFGLILTVAYVDTPLTGKVKSGLQSALAFDLNIDETLGKLKFVESNDSKVQSVMSASEKPRLTLPVKDCVVTTGQESAGLMLQANSLCDVVAPSDGVVENVDKENGFTVTLNHGNDVKTEISFTGALAVIEEGDAVKKNGYIGLVDKGSTVTFSVIDNGQTVNPKDYLE